MVLVVLVPAACGGRSQAAEITATAREYTFEGLPRSIEATRTRLTIDNQGGEVHQLHLFRLGDEVGTVAELLGRPHDEALDKLRSVGVATAKPGEQASFDAGLTPGRYAALCLIPAGTFPGNEVPAEDLEDIVFDPNPDTHFRRGMFAELRAA